MKTLMNYIDGTFVPAQSGDTIEDINPATGMVIADKCIVAYDSLNESSFTRLFNAKNQNFPNQT